MKKEQMYLSTIAPDAAASAGKFGIGLEIAEYCTAWNMDREFDATNARVEEAVRNANRRLLHAPFNELFPCAIDPKARELAAFRYRQAIALAKRYGASKVVIHGGYNGWIYYPCWYTEQSVVFWNAFLQEDPGVEIVLENVLEERPEMITEIVRSVDSPRLKLCLDVGHVNAYSPVPVEKWLEDCAPWLSHFHIHNNDGSRDAHCSPGEGTIPMEALLRQAESLCPEASFTLEVLEGEPALAWLTEMGILEGLSWKKS